MAFGRIKTGATVKGFDEGLAAAYTSAPQKIRVLTEHWVKEQAFCPNCGHPEMTQYKNNAPVADFYCATCKEDYELKSQRRITNKVLDGAYRTMIARLSGSGNPNFFLLSYNLRELSVENLLVIPKHFFTPEIIERRKPLSPSARRAGWVGCNILLSSIPHAGRIFLVQDGNLQPKEDVLEKWQRTLFLRQENTTSKGWLISVMRCVERLNSPAFSLQDVYGFEPELQKTFPANRHVREKIRQQLQVLRDKGYLEFRGKGSYRLTRQID